MVDSTIMCELKDMIENDNKCVICDENIIGYGNNAQPVKKGLCCYKCNTDVVIPARMEGLMKIIPEISEEQKKEIEKEKKRVYMREYMRNRRQLDPKFAEKVREANREHKAKRWTNPDLVQQNRDQQNHRYKKMRDAYVSMSQ